MTKLALPGSTSEVCTRCRVTKASAKTNDFLRHPARRSELFGAKVFCSSKYLFRRFRRYSRTRQARANLILRATVANMEYSYESTTAE
jgi:hypothetical protein